jgi:hypothetical protein
VIFLVDPLSAHPHDPDIQTQQRVCNVHDVPIATNLTTAVLIVQPKTIREAVEKGRAGNRSRLACKSSGFAGCERLLQSEQTPGNRALSDINDNHSQIFVSMKMNIMFLT